MRITRSKSRKNTLVDPKVTMPNMGKEELMKQLDAKIKESQLLKIVVEHKITTRILAIPRASITPIVLTIGIALGEGTSQVEDINQQAPPTQTLVSTFVPSHKQLTIHILESDLDQDDEPISMMANKRRDRSYAKVGGFRPLA